MKQLLIVLLSLLISSSLVSQNKKVVTNVDELPRYTYEIKGNLTVFLENDFEFKKLTEKVKSNYLKDLNQFIIEDKSTLKGYYEILMYISMLDQDFEKADVYLKKLKSLEDKKSAKLVSGITTKSIIETFDNVDGFLTPEFVDKFRNIYANKITPLPWNVVQDRIKGTKGDLEIFSKKLAYGYLEGQFQKAYEKAGNISGELASLLISLKYDFTYLHPLKEERLAILNSYIENNKSEKVNIWKDREFNFSKKEKCSKVRVAIWDSGIDLKLFENQLFENQLEIVDGLDNDGNNFVDDRHGIAYTLHCEKSKDMLFPLTKVQKENYESNYILVKGLTDLNSAIDSKEASIFREKLAGLKQNEIIEFIERISLFGNYAHGTHVAGIVANGNPYVELLNSRLTFDYHAIPELITVELAQKMVKGMKECIDYFKKYKVKVVNMSWGVSLKEIEEIYELNGVGKTAEDRKKMAKEVYDILRDGLFEEIKSAPEILFVCSAGNSNNNANFEGDIPASFDLPNILAVGAVDISGKVTSFTTQGPTVKVYSNGFDVLSYIPGGKKMKMSGTSMSSPNVVNLAAKILCVNPKLKATEVKELIITNSTQDSESKINLIDPKRTMEKVMKMNKSIKVAKR